MDWVERGIFFSLRSSVRFLKKPASSTVAILHVNAHLFITRFNARGAVGDKVEV